MGNSGTQIAFGTNFVGVFALLLDLHNSFSQLAAKRCKTNDASSMHNSILMKLLICLYQISLILAACVHVFREVWTTKCGFIRGAVLNFCLDNYFG